MSGRAIVHVEIPAANRESAAQFFKTVFGWELAHMQDPVPYTSGMVGSSPMGVGLPDLGEHYKPGDVIVYIHSEDIPADLDAIEKAGGKRAGEIVKIPPMGELAMFTDPTGNMLALWKSYPQADQS